MKKALFFLAAAAACAAVVMSFPSAHAAGGGAIVTKDILRVNADGSFVWNGDKDDVARSLFQEIAARDAKIEQLLAEANGLKSRIVDLQKQLEEAKKPKAEVAASSAPVVSLPTPVIPPSVGESHGP